jgi:hypothetical protein
MNDIEILLREQDGYPINATGCPESSYDRIRGQRHMELASLPVCVYRLTRSGSSYPLGLAVPSQLRN